MVFLLCPSQLPSGELVMSWSSGIHHYQILSSYKSVITQLLVFMPELQLLVEQFRIISCNGFCGGGPWNSRDIFQELSSVGHEDSILSSRSEGMK